MKNLRQTVLCVTLSAILTGCATPSFFAKKTSSDAENATASTFKTKGLKNPVAVHLAYAKWKEEVGDLKAAEESYLLVVSKDAQSIEGNLGLARIFALSRRHTEAEARFRSVLKESPTDPHVLDQVAQFYAETEQWNRAEQLLAQAVNLDPESKDYRYHHAVALAQLEATQRSYREFRHVMGDAESHYNIAYILHRKGNWTAAEQHLSHSLRIKPDLVAARNLMIELRAAGGQEMQYVSHQAAAKKPVRNSSSSPATADTAVNGTIEYTETLEYPEFARE